jgi:hypothetical protein
LVFQALGLVQKRGRSELGGWRSGKQSGTGGAVREREVFQERGPVLGLSEGRLCGRDEDDRPAGWGGEEDGFWEGGEAGVHWKISAHRPRSRGSTSPAANRFTEVPDGGGGIQDTPGRGLVSSLDSPALSVAAFASAGGVRGRAVLHAKREGVADDCRSADSHAEPELKRSGREEISKVSDKGAGIRSRAAGGTTGRFDGQRKTGRQSQTGRR